MEFVSRNFPGWESLIFPKTRAFSEARRFEHARREPMGRIGNRRHDHPVVRKPLAMALMHSSKSGSNSSAADSSPACRNRRQRRSIAIS